MIPEAEIQEVKQSTDILALFRSYGLKLEKKGKDWFTSCPFHDDSTPSLSINPEKKLFHCLGCGEKGNIFQFVQKMEGLTFPEAFERLAGPKSLCLKPTNGKDHPTANATSILKKTLDYYHQHLFEVPSAMNYLKRRGLWHEKAVKHFKIGYADRSFTMHLPPKAKKEGKHIRSRLVALGIIRGTGHGHYNGGLVFPVVNEKGIVTEVYGRKVNDGIRKDTKYHLYLPERYRTEHKLDRGMWNPAALESGNVILCESIIDALSFWVNGFKNVTASYGINGFGEDMLQSFVNKGVKRVYIAYDRDEAGERASMSLAEKLGGEGMECLRVKFPLGMDANEYIQKTTTPDKALRVLVESADWLGKGGKPSLKRIPINGQVKTIVKTNIATQPAASEQPISPKAESTSPACQAEDKRMLEVECEKKGQDYHITLGDRQYRVRGLHKNLNRDSLRVNLRVFKEQRYYLDTFELYNGRHREAFTLKASEEIEVKTDVIKRDLGRILLKLEELQDRLIESTLAKDEEAYIMTPQEWEPAMAFLKADNLIERLIEHLRACGHVGDTISKLTGYFSAVTRKLDDPIGVVIQSSSGVGKSSLMDVILRFMPPEEYYKYSSITEECLFYMQTGKLKHKILAIAEGQGAEKAGYSLKLLISEKELNKMSTGKDADTGRMEAQDYHVEGPTMVFYTSTQMEIEPELLSRCIVLHVDESKAQTEAILRQQRYSRTLEGKREMRRLEKIFKLHHNIQRLLRPIGVYNPYCPELSFSADQHHARRNQIKYLNLIDAIAFLHQYQRTLKKDSELGEYVEVTLADIELANQLANEVLGQSLEDMPPQTRWVLEQIYLLVQSICKEKAVEQSAVSLTRRQIREHTGLGNSQLAVHIQRLVELEYLIIHRGRNGSQYVYELLYQGEGQNGGKFFMGLIDVEELKSKMQNRGYDKNLPGVKHDLPASGSNLPGGFRGASGALPAGFRPGENAAKSNTNGTYSKADTNDPEKHYIELKNILHRIVITPVWGIQLFNIACNYLQAEYERETSSHLAADEPPSTGTHG